MGPRPELTNAFTGMRKDNDVSGLRMLFPVLALIGTCSLAGCSTSGLAAEDEPYLCDTSDPSFHLATPCEDITEERLEELGLTHLDEGGEIYRKQGLESCAFWTEDGAAIVVNAAAYKLARVAESRVPLPYAPSSEKQPALAFSPEGNEACVIGAEPQRGTVEVNYSSSNSYEVEPVDECPQAEKYFDLLIGEKLSEYRSH